jgi:hypothetical protein
MVYINLKSKLPRTLIQAS